MNTLASNQFIPRTDNPVPPSEAAPSMPPSDDIFDPRTIVVVGDKGVGKTTILKNWMAKRGNPAVLADGDSGEVLAKGPVAKEYSEPIRHAIWHTLVELDGEFDDLVYLKIIDTSDIWNAVKKYRRADAFIVVFSMTSASSFNTATRIYQDIQKLRTHPRFVALIGNKHDVAERPEGPSPEMIRAFEDRRVPRPIIHRASAHYIFGGESSLVVMDNALRQIRAPAQEIEEWIPPSYCSFVTPSWVLSFRLEWPPLKSYRRILA